MQTQARIVKRVHGMRLIAPKWEGQWLPRPTWARSTRNSLNLEAAVDRSFALGKPYG